MSKNPSDFLHWLSVLSEHDFNYFLEGGQAVNVWALTYEEKSSELTKYLPFASKDCDIWVDEIALRNIANVLDGDLKRGKSPSDGQLGIFTSKDKELTLDLLSNVYGLKLEELKKAQERLIQIQGIKIIDPLYLFKGKCHNLVSLPQIDRNDSKHLLMLGLIIPEYLKGFIEAIKQEGKEPRILVREIKVLLGFGKDRFVREAMKSLDISFRSIIPMDELLACEIDVIVKYAKLSLTPLFEGEI